MSAQVALTPDVYPGPGVYADTQLLQEVW